MEALSGSCLIIPCNFSSKPEEEFNSTRATFGVWIVNDHRFNDYPRNVIYNSSKTVNVYPMNITGNLWQRNCTTLFSDLKATHTDTYHFRIENGAFRATAQCNGLQINVKDSLDPKITISGDLRENVSVTITCSASTPCPHLPPKLTWNLQAAPDNHREENTDGTFTTKIQKTITLSDQHDGLTISCSASYPVSGGMKTAQTLVTLNVSYAPKDTSASISPSAVVSAGSWVNLSCSSRARPPVSSFTWFQISNDGAKAMVSEGEFYSFKAMDGGIYACRASNGLRKHWSPEILLTVEGTNSSGVHIIVKAVGVVLLFSSLVIFECCFRSRTKAKDTAAGDYVSLLGFVSVQSVDMATVSLLLSVVLLPGALADCTETSHLFITAPKMMEALNGSCLMIPCDFRTDPENLFISAKTVYGVWIKNNKNIWQNPDNVIYNSSGTVTTYPMNITGNLTQTNCTTLFSDMKATYTDTYYFRIDGSVKATAVCDPLQINVRDAPGSPRLTISGDLRENVSVTITCSASTPCPHLPPKLTWNLQAAPDNHREENTDGTFTTKIQETITLSDKHDELTINCSASYPVTEGIKTAKTQQTLNVSYAPKDTSASISPSAVVSAGSWVNLSCSSRARPPVSSFTWFQISSDGARTNVSEGAFYTFNATGGGVYYCVASNGLGAQASPQIHLTVTSVESVLLWEPVVGGILGIIALICLILCIWRLKSTQTVQQTQNQTDEAPTIQKEEAESIHYGEIAFAELRAGAPSDSVQNHQQQQDTVYAQVHVSNSASSSADAQLYSELKK
ncbi:uncharacterized protein LOC114852870 [Betta splendens]|uniref:Uncharacterized protein LOC114852870 n=1 Tax=Betta splendens TaxID=158456 RepID=A0A9W2XRJ4_BETSP|nr:uncharacterized protein LOC114852870 [Betta splendens]